MGARQHHYLPQFYLRGFTRNGARKSKLFAYDLAGQKRFQSTPRNVGGKRDFNRTNAYGADPNFIENELSKIESEISPTFRNYDGTTVLSENDRENVLNLAAMIAIRSPHRREHWRSFEEKIVKSMMRLMVQTKERWLSSQDPADLNIKQETYASAKNFVDQDQFSVSLSNDHHLGIEFKGVETVYPLLQERSWSVAVANAQTGPFICSDSPVVLMWNTSVNQQKDRPSPGFGLKNTMVIFPITQDIAIFGTFGGVDCTVEVDEKLVAQVITNIALGAHKYLYTPTPDFYLLDKNGNIVAGDSIFSII